METTLCVSHTPPYVYPRIAYPTPPLSVSRTHHAQCVWSPSPCKPYPYAWSSYRLPNTQSMCIHDFTTLHSVCGSLVCVTSQCVCMCVCIDSTVRLLVPCTGLLLVDSTSAVSWKLGLGRPWVGVIAHAWGNFLAGNSSTGMFFISKRVDGKRRKRNSSTRTFSI